MTRLSSFAAVAAVATLAGASACAPRPLDRPLKTSPIEQGPRSLQEARKFLEGRWSLVSFEAYPPGRAPVVLQGSGVLTYDDFSNLKIEIRTDAATAALLDKAGIVTQDGVVSSEGRAVLDLQGKKLTYVIEGQATTPGAPAGPLAMNRPRYWQVDGDILTLTTKDDNGQPLSVGKWKREPQPPR